MNYAHVSPKYVAVQYLFIVSIVCFLVGCKEKDDTLLPAQDYSSFNTFDKIRIGSGFRTTIRQGTTRQVLISVPASDQSNIQVSQASGSLQVDIVNKQSKVPGTVDITMPSLSGVELSGGVAATITGFTAGTLPITMSGGSTLTPIGNVQTLTLTLAGGSTFNGYNFPTTDAIVMLTGGSEARVDASKTLNVTASGGSKLFYKGAAVLTQTTTGDSTVTKE